MLAGHTHPRPTSLQQVGRPSPRSRRPAAPRPSRAADRRCSTASTRRPPSTSSRSWPTTCGSGSRRASSRRRSREAFELPLATVKRVHMLTGDIGETAVRAQAGETARRLDRAVPADAVHARGPVETPAEAMQRMGGKASGPRRSTTACAASCTATADAGRALLARPEGDHRRLPGAGRGGARDRPRRAVRRRGARPPRRPGAALLRAPAPAGPQGGLGRAARGGAGGAGGLRPALPGRRAAARRAARGAAASCWRASASSRPSCSRGSRRRPAPDDLDRIFAETRERGNEGLMVKRPARAPTRPGRRGLAWLKLKRPAGDAGRAW